MKAMLLFVSLMSLSSKACAELQVLIDLSEQSMKLSRNGVLLHVWPISTGTTEHTTPTGIFRPIRMHKNWYSIKYDGVPMPHSIFFVGGYAIHGTLETRLLGRPASRGCVRLYPESAKLLYDFVKVEGMSRTVIMIQE